MVKTKKMPGACPVPPRAWARISCVCVAQYNLKQHNHVHSHTTPFHSSVYTAPMLETGTRRALSSLSAP